MSVREKNKIKMNSSFTNNFTSPAQVSTYLQHTLCHVRKFSSVNLFYFLHCFSSVREFNWFPILLD